VKPVYIATFHQSKFGKLMGMTVPQIIDSAIQGACREIGTESAALDVGSIGAACNFSLNEQVLLSGLMANTPGLEGKPIEAVENACASGGQAVLSVIQKLQLGMGDTGIALALVDLAGFSKVDDQTLREAARRLARGLRKADTLARWGTAEFAIVLNDVRSETDCRVVLERLIAALDMDVAIGISLYPADAGDTQALERNADAARSRARQLGRRQYRFYPG